MNFYSGPDNDAMTDKGAVRWCAVILFVACIAAASQAVAQRNDSLEELLQRAGNHVRGYQREIPAIVAQETTRSDLSLSRASKCATFDRIS